jgi:Tfp pilus assembly protein FimT
VMKNTRTKGASLMEILVIVAIMGVIASIVTLNFSNYNRRQVVKSAVENIIALANRARSKTLLSAGSSQYGIHIEASRVVLFKGTSFTEPSTDNVQITLNSALSITNITLPSNVVWNRLTGDVGAASSFTVGITGDTNNQKVINIAKTGIVSSN